MDMWLSNRASVQMDIGPSINKIQKGVCKGEGV